MMKLSIGLCLFVICTVVLASSPTPITSNINNVVTNQHHQQQKQQKQHEVKKTTSSNKFLSTYETLIRSVVNSPADLFAAADIDAPYAKELNQQNHLHDSQVQTALRQHMLGRKILKAELQQEHKQKARIRPAATRSFDDMRANLFHALGQIEYRPVAFATAIRGINQDGKAKTRLEQATDLYFFGQNFVKIPNQDQPLQDNKPRFAQRPAQKQDMLDDALGAFKEAAEYSVDLSDFDAVSAAAIATETDLEGQDKQSQAIGQQRVRMAGGIAMSLYEAREFLGVQALRDVYMLYHSVPAAKNWLVSGDITRPPKLTHTEIKGALFLDNESVAQSSSEYERAQTSFMHDIWGTHILQAIYQSTHIPTHMRFMQTYNSVEEQKKADAATFAHSISYIFDRVKMDTSLTSGSGDIPKNDGSVAWANLAVFEAVVKQEVKAATK